jgi:hypothetical protein
MWLSRPEDACGARSLSNSAAATAFRRKPEATHEKGHEPEVDEPEEPDVDEPVDEVDGLPLVEDDADVLSLVDDVPEAAAGLVSPEDLASPEDFLA